MTGSRFFFHDYICSFDTKSCCFKLEKTGGKAKHVRWYERNTDADGSSACYTKQTLIINLAQQWICQRMYPKSSSTKLPGICPGILPLFFLFSFKHKPALHYTTSKSLSNYPVIHSKPSSLLLSPLMTSIKSNCETTGWTPEPSFSILWVYTSWSKLCGQTIIEAPLIFPSVQHNEASLL